MSFIGQLRQQMMTFSPRANIPQNDKEWTGDHMPDLTLLNDKDWSILADKACLVTQLIPFAEISEDGSLIAKKGQPYALVRLICKETNNPVAGEFVGAITHKDDFKALWWAFHVRGIGGSETPLVTWSKKNLNWFGRALSVFMPRLALVIMDTEAYRLRFEPGYRSDLKGRARWNAGGLPLLRIQPKHWKRKLVSTKAEDLLEAFWDTGQTSHFEEFDELILGPQKALPDEQSPLHPRSFVLSNGIIIESH
ncbi:hypothetical protein ACRAQ7_03715 [Erythrobacter sp. W53]|uniref:hypothetical protein n=1 Tax=Erythrobacter sp. W53 TaxID=3425947 RepID=UPI003D7680EC